MTAVVRTTTATVDVAVYRTDRHASVNLCLSQVTTSMVDHDEEKRTEQNLLYAAVNLNLRNLRSTYCTSEATDRHEASRGLSLSLR